MAGRGGVTESLWPVPWTAGRRQASQLWHGLHRSGRRNYPRARSLVVATIATSSGHMWVLVDPYARGSAVVLTVERWQTFKASMTHDLHSDFHEVVGYRLTRSGDLFAVRWGDWKIDDLDVVLKELERAHQSSGNLQIYLSVTDANTRRPNEEFRNKVLLDLNNYLGHAKVVYVLDLSSGFRASIMRSTLSSMLLLSKVRDRVKVVKSIDAMFAAEPEIDARTALRELRRDGILPDDESVSQQLPR